MTDAPAGLALGSGQRPKPSRNARFSCADRSVSPYNFPRGGTFNIAQPLFDLASKGSRRSVRTGEKLARGGFVRTDLLQADERTSLLRVMRMPIPHSPLRATRVRRERSRLLRRRPCPVQATRSSDRILRGDYGR
jgi:hypothetical protein